MKFAIWAMVAMITLGAVGGAVYLGVHDFNGGRSGGRSGGNHTSSGTSSQQQNIKNPEATSGKQTFHLNEDGTTREFIVYRPKSLDQADKVPVVFMFHGSGGDGELMYDQTSWKDEADKEGFMVVYPTGLKYHVYSDEKVVQGEVRTDVAQYQTKWNSYELPSLLDEKYPDQVPADDVQFTKDMVDFLKQNYSVDANRFYATGFSNGGQFTVRLIVEMPDTFAAFAPTAAGRIQDEVQAQIDASGQSPTLRPIIQVLGADDKKALHAADVDSFDVSEAAAQDGNPIKDNYISGFLTLEKLDDSYTYDDAGRTAHFTYSDSLVGANNEYQFYLVDGMQHIYPSGGNFRIDVVDYYWPFFEKYTL